MNPAMFRVSSELNLPTGPGGFQHGITIHLYFQIQARPIAKQK